MRYVVIEAGAAGTPVVAANVGGIPEIFGCYTDALFAPNIVGALADAIETGLEDPGTAQVRARSLRERVFLHFSQKAMVEGVLAGYRAPLADRLPFFTTHNCFFSLFLSPAVRGIPAL